MGGEQPSIWRELWVTPEKRADMSSDRNRGRGCMDLQAPAKCSGSALRRLYEGRACKYRSVG